MVIEQLLERFPFLSSVPDDAPEGVDSTLPPAPPIHWSHTDNLLPDEEDVDVPSSPMSQRSIDEEEVEHRRRNTPWRDWALAVGAEVMGSVRKEIWTRLHYTTSAGIAHSKAMAKVNLVPVMWLTSSCHRHSGSPMGRLYFDTLQSVASLPLETSPR